MILDPLRYFLESIICLSSTIFNKSLCENINCNISNRSRIRSNECVNSTLLCINGTCKFTFLCSSASSFIGDSLVYIIKCGSEISICNCNSCNFTINLCNRYVYIRPCTCNSVIIKSVDCICNLSSYSSFAYKTFKSCNITSICCNTSFNCTNPCVKCRICSFSCSSFFCNLLYNSFLYTLKFTDNSGDCLTMSSYSSFKSSNLSFLSIEFAAKSIETCFKSTKSVCKTFDICYITKINRNRVTGMRSDCEYTIGICYIVDLSSVNFPSTVFIKLDSIICRIKSYKSFLWIRWRILTSIKFNRCHIYIFNLNKKYPSHWERY